MKPVADNSDLDAFIRCMPKAELHMHLEGSIEAELLLDLAVRNGMQPRWPTAEALRAAYRFRNLQSFLNLYYEGCRVLVQERDFYDITRAYLRRAHADAVVRAEVFIGPQGFRKIALWLNVVVRLRPAQIFVRQGVQAAEILDNHQLELE